MVRSAEYFTVTGASPHFTTATRSSEVFLEARPDTQYGQLVLHTRFTLIIICGSKSIVKVSV